MFDSETDLLRENPSWHAVLQAYAKVFEELAGEEAASVEADNRTSESDSEIAADLDESIALDDDADCSDDSEASEAEDAETRKTRRRQPWAPRLTAVDGIESDELSKIHGRLIAYGLLKCDLADRAAGVVYQLTSEARRAIETLANSQADDEPTEDGDHEFSRSA